MFMLTTVSYLLWHYQTLQFHTYSTSNTLCRYQDTSLLSRSLGGCRKVWLRCRYVREHVCLSCSGTATRVAAGGLKLLYHFKINWNAKTAAASDHPRFLMRVPPTRTARFAFRCAYGTCTRRYFPQASPAADWPSRRTNERARHASSGVCACVYKAGDRASERCLSDKDARFAWVWRGARTFHSYMIHRSRNYITAY